MARRGGSIQEQGARRQHEVLCLVPTWLRMSKQSATPELTELVGFDCESSERMVQTMVPAPAKL